MIKRYLVDSERWNQYGGIYQTEPWDVFFMEVGIQQGIAIAEYWSDSHMYIILTLQSYEWVRDHKVMFNSLQVNSDPSLKDRVNEGVNLSEVYLLHQILAGPSRPLYITE